MIFKCNKWQYCVYFKSRKLQSVRSHKWTTFSHNNHVTNQRAPVYDVKMWILALQSPFCFTWRKVVHTAPQNSTGNEVNMGSRNSEYLNYFFLYVKMTNNYDMFFRRRYEKYSGLICLKILSTWHVRNKDIRRSVQVRPKNRTEKSAVFILKMVIDLKYMVLKKHS